MTRDSFKHIEDKELLQKFYDDADNQWLGVLLQRYTMLLLGVCMKYMKNEEEARDCVQQIFLKVIVELQKYKVDYFKSWLYMIAKNYCLMKIRDRNGKIPAELDDAHLPAEPDIFYKDDLIEKDRMLDLTSQSLAELSNEQEQCVTLFYLEKKSYQQVAELTGYNLQQVKSYIQNGKRNLRNLVEKKMRANG